MRKEIIKLSSIQIIRNDIEEIAKNGGGKLKLSDWEHDLDLDHRRVVEIIWNEEERRVNNGEKGFIKPDSYNVRGRPSLNEIEIPSDNKLGAAKIVGETMKRDERVRRKAERVKKYKDSAMEDMKSLKPRNFKKITLFSDSLESTKKLK